MLSSPAINWVGQALGDGRFQIGDQLGEGGMAVVFEATDLKIHKRVVVKIPKPNCFADEASLKRFAKESQALLALSHQHIVQILHIGEHQGWPFTVMQFLGGGDLEACRLSFGGKLSLKNISMWVRPIAGALDFVHAKGFIHRDVKPANILFDGKGRPFLSDFGIAKGAGGSKATKLTGTGQLLGTPDYMAPELIMGSEVDGRVDQYALAITVFECLSGRTPFESEMPGAVFVKQTTEPPPLLVDLDPGLPVAVSNVINRALSKSPDDRFSTCTEFAEYLLAGLQDTLQWPQPMTPAAQQNHAFEKQTERGQRNQTQADSHPLAENPQTQPWPDPTDVHLEQEAETRQNFGTANHSPPNRNAKKTSPRSMEKSATNPSKPRRIITPWMMGVSVLLGAATALLIARALIPSGEEKTEEVITETETNETVADVPKLKPYATFSLQEGKWFSTSLLADSGTKPAKGFSFQLEKPAPNGMHVQPKTGQLAWTPSEAQGPGSFPFSVTVRDASGKERAKQSYKAVVGEVNTPPLLSLPNQIEVDALKGIRLRLLATDDDLPTTPLVWSATSSLPAGCQLDSQNGMLIWPASELVNATGRHTISLRATDQGTPAMSASGSITVLVNHLDVSIVSDHSIAERQTLQVPILAKFAGATDREIQFAVEKAPINSRVDPKTGQFEWTPSTGAAGRREEVAILVSTVGTPALKRTVRFHVDVESRTPTAYWDLPELPTREGDLNPAVLLKDAALTGEPELSLLGFATLSDKVSTKRDSTGDLVAYYHTPEGSLDKELPPLQELARFTAGSGELKFSWAFHKGRLLRRYQQLVREGVLKLQPADGDAKFFVLQTPQQVPVLDLADVLNEPYDNRRILRLNPIPSETSRNWRLDAVHLLNSGSVSSGLLDGRTSQWSFPGIAAALNLQKFALAFDEQADEFVWRVETEPSLSKAFKEHSDLRTALVSAKNSLRKSTLDYNKNYAAYLSASTDKKLRLDKASYGKKAATAQKNMARYQRDVISLQPKSAAATETYETLKSSLASGRRGKVSTHVYRDVAGFKLKVLTISNAVESNPSGN